MDPVRVKSRMLFIRLFFSLFCLFIFLNNNELFAFEKGVQLKREVIGLWDSREANIQDSQSSPIHQHLEVVLNHYGLKVRYVDVNKGIPEDLQQVKNIQKYAGVISWFFDGYMKYPLDYMSFLKRVAKAKVKLLVMGELGFTTEVEEPFKEFSKLKINKVMNLFDFNYDGGFYNNPLILKPVFHGQREQVEFERSLGNEISSVTNVTKMSSFGSRWLQIEVVGSDVKSDVIFTNPKMSYVQRGFDIFTNPKSFLTQWRVNPFELVKETFFKNELTFSPDTTTLNGNRIFYTHIDGDGYINLSLVDQKSLSGQIIIEKIIKTYELPFTVSVIVAKVSSQYLGNEEYEKQIREMYALDNVEGASHTYTHPMSWELDPSENEKEQYLDDKDIKTHKGPIVGYPLKNYVMNYETEVVESLSFINKNYMPKGKEAKILLWSGSCIPPEEPLKLLRENNLMNLNGGDSIFDGELPSYSQLAPLIRKVGGETQIYSSNANENIYTNLWHGPYNGFRRVIETFKNTEKPIRIKPINIYYHFYSGERVSSLGALKETYDYALSQEISPVYASEYIDIVKGWISAEYSLNKKNDYSFKNLGQLKTIRFDSNSLFPDYKKSKNVIGHRVVNDSLYVSLGSDDSARIILTKEKPKGFFISRSNSKIEKITSGQIEGHGHVPLMMTVVKNGIEKVITSKEKGPYKVEVSW